jgi:hypothetical protein
MMAAWMSGLLRVRGPALLASTAGAAVAVVLLALLGLFIANSAAMNDSAGGLGHRAQRTGTVDNTSLWNEKLPGFTSSLVAGSDSGL